MRIKELRIAKNCTQSTLAELIQVSQQNISKYENGKLEPDITSLIALANFFEVSLDYLVERDFTPACGVPEQYIKVSSEEKTLLHLWNELDEDDKDLVLERINTLLEVQKRKKEA